MPTLPTQLHDPWYRTEVLIKSTSVLYKNMLSFAELELPEVDRTIGTGSPNEYIESPMSDGTIEEDFEKALAREVADRRLSGDTGEGFSKKDKAKVWNSQLFTTNLFRNSLFLSSISRKQKSGTHFSVQSNVILALIYSVDYNSEANINICWDMRIQRENHSRIFWQNSQRFYSRKWWHK